jgi:error-prone DNA polymerase
MPVRPDGTRRVLSQRITVAGLTLVRQRPGTASGVIFMTIEDESGVANIVVWPKIFERMRAAVIGARLVSVTGRVQREGEVIHVVAERVEDWSAMLADLSSEGPELKPFIPADEGKGDHGDDAPRGGLSPDRQLRLDGLLAPRPAAGVRREDTRGAPAPARGAEAERARRAMPKGRNFH